jgi:hypothetical protein
MHYLIVRLSCITYILFPRHISPIFFLGEVDTYKEKKKLRVNTLLIAISLTSE